MPNMSMSIQKILTLKAIRCLRAMESDGDELYCTVACMYGDGSRTREHRLPENNIWRVNSGDAVVLNSGLYQHDGLTGVAVNIVFHEEDIPNMVRGVAVFMKSMLPDATPTILSKIVGEVTALISTSGAIVWQAGVNAAEIEMEDDDLYRFRLAGSQGYEYIIDFLFL